MTVLIYQDYTHNNGILYRSLCRHFGTDNVDFCDAQDIVDGVLNQTVKILVMPGGADLYYVEKLNGRCNDLIQTYVRDGGTYLGICAGAYYASKALKWADKEQLMAVMGPRELAFFPGTATGPIYKFLEDEDITKSWWAAPNITYKDDDFGMDTPVFYAAGPVFEEKALEENADKVTVLARYEDLDIKPAAIISCKVGIGKAVLSSPHIEYTASDLYRKLYKHQNLSFEWEQNVAKKLDDHKTDNRRLWSYILEHCTASPQLSDPDEDLKVLL